MIDFESLLSSVRCSWRAGDGDGIVDIDLCSLSLLKSEPTVGLIPGDAELHFLVHLHRADILGTDFRTAAAVPCNLRLS